MEKGISGVVFVLAVVLLVSAAPVSAQPRDDIKDYIDYCNTSKNPDSVIRSCSLAIESGQQNGKEAQDIAGWYNNRGIAYSGKGEFDLAIEDFDRAMELDPENADALFSRGTTYHKMCDYPSAIRDYDAVLRMRPNLAGVLHNRDLASRKTGGDLILCLMRQKNQ